MDVVGAFCDGIGLGDSMCDFLRAALDMLGIHPNDIEGELREKGKDRLCAEIVDLIGADFPGGASAARTFCKDVLGKLEAQMTGSAAPTSPSAPNPALLIPQARATAVAVDPSGSVGTSKVMYRCQNGRPVCVAVWPGGSRVLSDRECARLSRPVCPSPYPTGTIAAEDRETGDVRIAVPKPPTASPDAPSFLEVAASNEIPPDVLRVSLRDFLRQTGQLPLYKDPIFWSIAVGSATVLGGAIWVRRRRRG